jgi:hypothetical protein
MITKILDDTYNYEKYNVRVTDKNNKSFIMMCGGNMDLYWVPENWKDTTSFIIPKEDEFTYNMFSKIFKAVEQNDNKYNPVLVDDVITFYSEEATLEESDILKICKTDEQVKIDFIRNEDKESWTYPHRGCPICFCNSGSRIPKVEQQFMLMFNYLAYQCKKIDIEKFM